MVYTVYVLKKIPCFNEEIHLKEVDLNSSKFNLSTRTQFIGKVRKNKTMIFTD